MALETFGQKLRRCRRERGYTQNELGDLIGMTGGSISRYECGYAVDRQVRAEIEKIMPEMLEDAKTTDTSKEQKDETASESVEPMARIAIERDFYKARCDELEKKMLEMMMEAMKR